MDGNVALILRALLAIFLGSVGVVAIFYGLNILVEKAFPERLRVRVLPWIYVGPSVLLLTVYLVIPTIRTFYLSFFGNNSDRFVGLQNYIFVLHGPRYADYLSQQPAVAGAGDGY